jgi:hypothetical protein
LVLNNLSDAAKSLALQRGLCPPTLAGAKRSGRLAQQAAWQLDGWCINWLRCKHDCFT